MVFLPCLKHVDYVTQSCLKLIIMISICKIHTYLRGPIVAVRIKHPQISDADQEQQIDVLEIIDTSINELKKKMKIKDDTSIIHTTEKFFITSIQRICFPQSFVFLLFFQF